MSFFQKKKNRKKFQKASKRPVLFGIEYWCRLTIDMHYLYVSMYLVKKFRGGRGALSTYIIKSNSTPRQKEKSRTKILTYICSYYLFLSKNPSTCATSSPFFLLDTSNPLV